jgi:hypothetical protein
MKLLQFMTMPLPVGGNLTELLGTYQNVINGTFKDRNFTFKGALIAQDVTQTRIAAPPSMVNNLIVILEADSQEDLDKLITESNAQVLQSAGNGLHKA